MARAKFLKWRWTYYVESQAATPFTLYTSVMAIIFNHKSQLLLTYQSQRDEKFDRPEHQYISTWTKKVVLDIYAIDDAHTQISWHEITGPCVQHDGSALCKTVKFCTKTASDVHQHYSINYCTCNKNVYEKDRSKIYQRASRSVRLASNSSVTFTMLELCRHSGHFYKFSQIGLQPNFGRICTTCFLIYKWEKH